MQIARLGLVLALTSLWACDRQNDNTPAASASASSAPASASAAANKPKVDTKGVAIGVPYPAEQILKAVNPKGEEPYKGPVGTLRGVVRIEGDAPLDTGLSFPDKCKDAAATYGKLFRVGADKAAADVLVAVTGYTGFVPEREAVAKTTLHGCAVDTRTLVMTYGQRLEVRNVDQVDTYMPFLDGAPSRAILVAVPGGDPIKMYPQEPGHYMIRDELPKPFMTSDVFVLAYSTHDVTGLDGKYEIKNIPVGKVRLSALLPSIDQTTEQMIEIKEGDNNQDLTITFDKAKYLARPKPATSASAGAAPSASAPPAAPGPKG